MYLQVIFFIAIYIKSIAVLKHTLDIIFSIWNCQHPIIFIHSVTYHSWSLTSIAKNKSDVCGHFHILLYCFTTAPTPEHFYDTVRTKIDMWFTETSRDDAAVAAITN